MSAADTTSAAFFEGKYRREADPWNFATSGYEQSRYATIIQSIHNRQYERAFEPGCAIGELTVRLAPFCRQLTACEISPTAANQARKRCSQHPSVTVVCESIPGFIPKAPLDLIVFSEIAYYFDCNRLGSLGNQLAARLNEGGVFVAAHWLGFSPDHRISGDQAHEVLETVSGISHVTGCRYEGFRLDKWIRR